MSSATSIENVLGDADVTNRNTSVPPAHSTGDQGFRPWHFFVLASLVAATAAVVMSRQTSPEHLILISLVIAAAGLAAVGFYRMLAPLASDEVMPGTATLSDRTRAALEREKMLTLRSIKELEFDHAMGKISATDFDEIAGRLRGRAIALMKELDAGSPGYREEIERELEARLARRAASSAGADDSARRCGSCGTGNDSDAAFCKRCGARIGVPAAQEP